MTPLQIKLAFWIGLAVVLVGLAGATKYLSDRNAELKAAMETQTKAIETLSSRAERIETVLIENEAFDADVRTQQARVQVVIDDARRSDPNAAQILDTRIPDSLRGRVFDDADPTGRTAPAGGAPAAGEGGG